MNLEKFDGVTLAKAQVSQLITTSLEKAMEKGTLPKEELHEMMDKKPEHTELVITGHQYGMSIDDLIERADYVTKLVKEKHPFDLGMPCRTGIEE